MVAVLDAPPPARLIKLRPYRAGIMPLAFTTALAALSAIGPVAQNPRLFWSFLGTAGALLLWDAALAARASAGGRALMLEIVLRKQHYPGVRTGIDPAVLGLVLARGLSFGAVSRRAASFRVRLRHAAGLQARA